MSEFMRSFVQYNQRIIRPIPKGILSEAPFQTNQGATNCCRSMASGANDSTCLIRSQIQMVFSKGVVAKEQFLLKHARTKMDHFSSNCG